MYFWCGRIKKVKITNFEGLKKNVNFQIEQGITGVLAVGTSGESPTLSWEEHNKVIETVVSVASGRCKVMAGTGSNSTKEAIVNSKHADELGVNGCLLVDCYYNGPSSSELRDEYYAKIDIRRQKLRLILNQEYREFQSQLKFFN